MPLYQNIAKIYYINQIHSKTDREEQISVAMFSLPHICHVSRWARLWTHLLLANRKAANTLGMR